MNSPIESAPANTVRISATRFEQSPYYANYANAKTVLGVAAGRYYAADNGEDPMESYWALRREAVLFGPGDWVGKTLQLKTRRCDRVSCEVVSLPFYDSAKHIPRGVDRTIPERRR